MYRNNQIAYRILDACFRYAWLVILCVAGVAGTAWAVLGAQSKTYSANAMTRVAGNELADALGGAKDERVWITPAQRNVDQLNDLLNDDRPEGFLVAALKNAKLDTPLNPSPNAEDKRYEEFRKNLSVYTNSSATFSVGLTWDNPGECERIVTAIQDECVKEIENSQNSRSSKITAFLDTQIESYAARMRRAESALTAYKQSHSGELPEAQDADVKQLALLRTKLDELRVTAQDGALKLAALRQRAKQVTPFLELRTTQADDPVAKQLRELEMKRELLLVDYKPHSQEVLEVDNQIAAIRRFQKASAKPNDAVTSRTQRENPEYRQVMRQLTDADIEQRTNAAQTALLARQVASYEERVRRMPAAQRELADKTRDYSILKEQYERLLQRREQAKLTANIDRLSASTTLARLGVVDAKPTLSRKKVATMMIGAVMVGLILGFVMVTLREWSDGSLRYEEDVETLLGIPVLASLPESRSGRSTRAPAPALGAGISGNQLKGRTDR